MSINAYVGKIFSPFLAGIDESFTAKYTQLYHTLHSLVNLWITRTTPVSLTGHRE